MRRNTVFIVLAFAVIVALLLFRPIYFRMSSLYQKEVQSDSRIIDEIETHFGADLPDTAHHLYVARNRSLFVDRFVAFTLQNKNECESLLADIGFELADFKQSNTLPQRLIDNGPESWGQKYSDKNWQLSKEKDFMIVSEGGFISMAIYSPEKCRIYLVHWAE